MVIEPAAAGAKACTWLAGSEFSEGEEVDRQCGLSLCPLYGEGTSEAEVWGFSDRGYSLRRVRTSLNRGIRRATHRFRPEENQIVEVERRCLDSDCRLHRVALHIDCNLDQTQTRPRPA